MKYFFPYIYGFETRAKSIFYKVSFAAYILIPNFLILFLYYGASGISEQLINFMLAFTAMYSVYEIGYLQNDTFTVKIENEPSYRLKKEQRDYVERYALLLIAFHFGEAVVLAVILYIRQTPYLWSFVLMLCMLYVAYAFYNSFRNKSNIIAIFFVLLGKYCAVPMLFIPLKGNAVYYITLILAIPLYRTIEMAMAAKRYGLNVRIFSPSCIDRTRVIYYLIMFLGAFVLMAQNREKFFPPFMVFGYLLLFRMFCFIAIKNKKIMNNRKNCLRVEKS